MSAFPQTKATDFTELVMMEWKKKFPEFKTFEYNRTYEAVYEVASFLFPDEKNYTENISGELARLRSLEVKAREVVRETAGYADGAPDASLHDRMCNYVSGTLSPLIGKEAP